MIFNYTVTVEPDPLKEDKYMVVIKRMPENSLVGTPARNLDKTAADELVNICRFAFDYGLNEARVTLSSLMFNVRSPK